MSYRFILPADVENQVYDCALFIARDNPGRALSWVDEVVEMMESVCEWPDAHSVDESMSRLVGRTIRRRAFGEYLMFYEVDMQARAVVMHLFIHAKRDRSSDEAPA